MGHIIVINIWCNMNNAEIFWCTGMSGVGKTTLALHAHEKLIEQGYSSIIIDGDVVRERYNVKLGFGRQDVENNNLNVADLCEIERNKYDAIIVPIISPIDIVRCAVKKILDPGFHLIFITASMDALKERDPKGLYKKAENGEILDLIGYSSVNPYEVPVDYDLMLETSNSSDLDKTKREFSRYILKTVAVSNTLF